MGLASSQARLLTLTGRQHSVELRAQRIMADKLRLANDSDRVYQQYINALDDTQLKTQWTNQHGAVTWVNGSINNLLRYDADEDTAGTTFFVQDLSNGKLYIPVEMGNAYDSSSSAEEFAEKFGIVYKQIDLNEDIVTNYNKVLNKGYDTLLGDNDEECTRVYNEYIVASNKDTSIQNNAKAVLNAIIKNEDGNYVGSGDYGSLAKTFTQAISDIKSSPEYDTVYVSNKDIINKATSILTTPLDIPKDNVTCEESLGLYHWYERSYINGQLTAENTDAPPKNYINISVDEINDSIMYELMLNGGVATYSGYEKYTYYITNTNDMNSSNRASHEYYTTPIEKTYTIYDSSTEEMLLNYNNTNNTSANNLGDVLTDIFTKASKYNQNVAEFLSSKNLTKDDIEHYKEYLTAKNKFAEYTPDYTLVPDNKTKATYYENIYYSIKSAGGWIEAGNERAKSDSWVGNMIKSNQVILAVWDNETETLSKTAAELNTKIREVTDENKVEQVSQDYEAEMAIINKKDKDFDTKLTKLETERNAITTEIEGIKQVMGNNVDTTFKLFS